VDFLRKSPQKVANATKARKKWLTPPMLVEIYKKVLGTFTYFFIKSAK